MPSTKEWLWNAIDSLKEASMELEESAHIEEMGSVDNMVTRIKEIIKVLDHTT